MEYQCKQCGKIFTPKHSKCHTYCCYQCFTDYRNDNSESLSRVPIAACPICGKTFKQVSGGHGKKKYCSSECQNIALRKYEEIPCAQCGTMFYNHRGRLKYCSVKCSNDSKRIYESEADQRRAYNKIYYDKRAGDRESRAKERQEKRLLREAEQKRIKELALIKRTRVAVCENCGEEFTTTNATKRYCKPECANRKRNNDKETKRRTRLRQNGTIDWSVTLDRLIKRDKNVCHICGGRCNNKDKQIDANGTTICGNSYPSIDHINPVSNGGTHTWDNIKLAHRGCNTAKSCNEIFEVKGGQMMMAM